MKLYKVFIAACLGLASVSANAATIFAPTDGDVNFLFGDLAGGTLAMFDDSDQDYLGSSIGIDVPSIVGFTGPISGDYIATNSSGNTLTLTDSDQFILGLNVGGNWLSDSGVIDQGANSYTVLFNNGGSVLEIDVQVVSAVPVPAAVWLFGSGLLGLIGIARRK